MVAETRGPRRRWSQTRIRRSGRPVTSSAGADSCAKVSCRGLPANLQERSGGLARRQRTPEPKQFAWCAPVPSESPANTYERVGLASAGTAARCYSPTGAVFVVKQAKFPLPDLKAGKIGAGLEGISAQGYCRRSTGRLEDGRKEPNEQVAKTRGG